jgi:hypothetical protein
MAATAEFLKPIRRWGGVAAGVAALAWAGIVAAGFLALSAFDATPGLQREAPARWPAASALPAPAGRFALVLVIHPHCPCSRASVGELATILQRCRGRLDVHVLCYRPAGAGPEWAESATARQARGLPEVAFHWDEGGAEARRFGALTSGHVVVYGARGERLFAGGITRGRAQSGDSPGRSAVIALVAGEAGGPGGAQVYGCPLCGPGAPQTADGTP